MQGTTRTSGQSYRGIAADERRATRRQQLIEAAIKVYGQTGVQGATVKAICDAAQLTERYFYESFSNSQALFVATFETVTDYVLDTVREASRRVETPGKARVEAIIRAYCCVLKENPATARVFVVEIAAVGGEVEAVLDRGLAGLADLLDEALGRGRRRDPMLEVGVAGGLNRMAKKWIASDYALPVGKFVAAAVRLSSVLEQSR